MNQRDAWMGSPAWKRLRRSILIRDGFVCHWGCGRRATEADHLVAVAEGGRRWDPANLVAACRRCNARRGGEVGVRRTVARAGATHPPRVHHGAIRA